MEKLLSIIILFIVSPFFLIAFLAVKLTSKGPFLFKQKRVGKNGHPFIIYKIRSMIENAESLQKGITKLNEADGPVFKIRNDPRFTYIGKILSRSGLDEIPQLINIIKGEMSFVGPRPLPISEANNIPQKYNKRLTVKPGITSLWVINGTHNLSFDEWMQLDLEYLKKKNIFLDLSISIITIFLIVKWNNQRIFLLLFPFILLFISIYPDFIWFAQILVFFSVVLLLGFDMKRKPSLLLFALIFLITTTTLFSINKISSVPILFSYYVLIIISSYFVEDQKTTFIKAFIAGTLMIGFLSIFYTSYRLFNIQIPPFLSFIDNGFNLVIPYFGQAFYGIYIVSTLPFVLERNFKKNVLLIWRIIFVAYLVILTLTFSKSAIIISVLEIILFFIHYWKTNSTLTHFKSLLIILFVFSLLEFGIIFNLSKNNWLEKKIIKPSLYSRIEYWRQSKQTIINMPFNIILTGYGLDTFFELSNMYQSLPDFWVKSAHNYFVQFYIENGIIALLLFIYYLFLTLRRNYKIYSFSEKVMIASLILFSCGSTVDIDHFPILMFLLIIINKNTDQMILERQDSFTGLFSRLIKVITDIIIFILLTVWIIYLFVYLNFSFINKNNQDITNIFPYELIFWNILINKTKDVNSLIQIKNNISKYSPINADLEKKITNKLYTIGEYCNALNHSADYLINIPFDLKIQDVFNQSKEKCIAINKDKIDGFFQKYKSHLNVSDQALFQIRRFLLSTAIYYLNDNNLPEYQYWFGQAWKIDLNNPKNDYYSDTYYQDFNAFPINKSFVINLSLEVENEIGGITLFSKQLPNDQIWWTVPKLFIGLKDNGKKLHIDISDGISQFPITIYDAAISKSNEVYRFEFDKKGYAIKIFSKENKLLGYVDINKKTGNRFPNGFFTESTMYLGYIVGPNSRLIIRDYSILPTGNKLN